MLCLSSLPAHTHSVMMEIVAMPAENYLLRRLKKISLARNIFLRIPSIF